MTQNNSTTTSTTDVETTNLLDAGHKDVADEIAAAPTPAAPALPDGNDDQSRMENADSDDPLNKKQDEAETSTNATMESEKPLDVANNTIQVVAAPSSGIIVSSTKKSRPQYKFDPEKITLRFLFANRDGLTVTVECKPSDTVGEVKGALISVWPKDMPCDNGDNLRLICMGKGYLSPDSRTLADCQIPVFKTHPTPINVSVKPSEKPKAADGRGEIKKKPNGVGNSPTSQQPSHAHASNSSGAGRSTAAVGGATETSQGCGCVIQ